MQRGETSKPCEASEMMGGHVSSTCVSEQRVKGEGRRGELWLFSIYYAPNPEHTHKAAHTGRISWLVRT